MCTMHCILPYPCNAHNIIDIYDVVSPISCNESKTGRKIQMQTQFAKNNSLGMFPLVKLDSRDKMTKLNLSNPLKYNEPCCQT